MDDLLQSCFLHSIIALLQVTGLCVAISPVFNFLRMFLEDKGMKRLTKGIRTLSVLIGLVSYAWCGSFSPAQFLTDNGSFVTNYPNPFDSRHEFTTIVYFLKDEAEVGLKIYDLFGNLVLEYPKAKAYCGVKTVVWDGRNESGQKVSKGGYIAIIEIDYASGQFLVTRKIGVIH